MTETTASMLRRVETPKHTYLCESVSAPQDGMVKLTKAMAITATTPAELAKEYVLNGLKKQLRDIDIAAAMVIASEELPDVTPIVRFLEAFIPTAEQAVLARQTFDELLKMVPQAPQAR